MRTMVRRGLVGLAAAALIGVGSASAVGAEEAISDSTAYANNETGEVLVVPAVPGYAATLIVTDGPAAYVWESYVDEPSGDNVVVEFI